MMVRKQAGFTLVEIAIVLVIIGLLLGGVLKGQELITQAKIKNVANDFSGLTVAILSYQERYKALPGDDAGAANRWSGAPAGGTSGGAPNNKIDGNYNSTTEADESRLMWRHLRYAGFIGGDPASSLQPTNAAGGIIGVQWNAMGMGGHAICSAGLSGKIAAAIDAQADDGLPNTGTVRGLIQAVSGDAGTTTPTNSPNAYQEDGSTLYIICKQL